MFAVFKKEFKNYFFNPIGYIFMSIFFAISGILFFLNIFFGHYIFFGHWKFKGCFFKDHLV